MPYVFGYSDVKGGIKVIGAEDSKAEAVAPTDFGPAKKYVRHGSSHHKSGWQERHPVERATVEGERTAPLAPEGSIPRTTLAERLHQRVAERRED
jgi:hypothetical protein